MRSLLHAEDLLSSVEDVISLHHPLLLRLRPAAYTLSILPKARDFGDGDASYIRRYACSLLELTGTEQKQAAALVSQCTKSMVPSHMLAAG
jgi:hypothetical protein